MLRSASKRTPALRTIEDGVHTYDIYDEGSSKQKVGTKEFAQAVVDRLARSRIPCEPLFTSRGTLAEVYSEDHSQRAVDTRKELVGVDVYLDWLKRVARQSGNGAQERRAGGSGFGNDQQPGREGLAGRQIRNVLL